MFRTILHGITLIVFAAFPLLADTLDAPQGDILLTVSGNVAVTNKDDTAQLDLALLKSLETTTIETATIWTEGTQTFKGVSLAVLVEALALEGRNLRATAINDYAIDIPMSDAVKGGPIVAFSLNGSKMSVRDKGPLWIVYPYDANAEYRSEVIYSRSIWQLKRIEAID